MRDLLIAALLAGLLPLAMTRTWIAVLLWTWVSMMNPHKLAYGFAHDMPIAMLVAIAALVSLLVDRKRLHMPSHGAVTCLLLFLVWTGVTTINAIHVELSVDQLIKVSKIQLLTLIALAAIRERKHIQAFVAVNALSVAFYGVKGGLFTLRTGGSGRVWGPPGGFFEGNNELGLALVMVIPLLFFLYGEVQHRWLRRGLMATMLLSALSALGTQSRGAFLAISAMGLLLWLRSERKSRMILPLILLATAFLIFMPDTWSERMGTIKTYEEDGSAMGRINAWWMAFNLANDRFLGAGYAATSEFTFSRWAPDPTVVRAAHSIYFQILGEHGWVGLALFLGIGLFTWRECSRLRRQTHELPEARWVFRLASMIQVSMIGYAVGGAFLSLAYFDLPYNIMVMVVACRYWVSEQRWKLDVLPAAAASKTRQPGPRARLWNWLTT